MKARRKPRKATIIATKAFRIGWWMLEKSIAATGQALNAVADTSEKARYASKTPLPMATRVSQEEANND